MGVLFYFTILVELPNKNEENMEEVNESFILGWFGYFKKTKEKAAEK